MGLIPEEMMGKFGHRSLRQVHAARAYYRANQAEIDGDLEAEAREADALVYQHGCLRTGNVGQALGLQAASQAALQHCRPKQQAG